MPKLPEVVTKKIGPLPLWGWVVAGAGTVFIVSRFKGGGSSSGSSAGGIGIPVLQPGGSSSGGTGSIGDGGNAVGSPGHNAQGGTDTQPGGAPPWWATPPPWWNVTPPGAPASPAAGSPGTNPGGATAGPLPHMSVWDRMNLFQSAVPEGGFTPGQQAELITSAQRLGGRGGTYNGPTN